MKKLKALITNDDGINCKFLHHLIYSLMPNFDISVAAPESEQSWIGRAISRRKSLRVTKNETLFPKEIKAWSISGTPTDCVNIALGHLIDRPDIVLSGINLGYNTTEILILSSGTIAGAIEGSLWGIPSIAFSQSIPKEKYDEIHTKDGETDKEFEKTIKASAKKANEIALDFIKSKPRENAVLNVNFPEKMNNDNPIEITKPEKIRLGSLFKIDKNGHYKFEYKDGEKLCDHDATDRAALKRGSVSITKLDFTKICNFE